MAETWRAGRFSIHYRTPRLTKGDIPLWTFELMAGYTTPSDWIIPTASFLEDLSQSVKKVAQEYSWTFGMIGADGTDRQHKVETRMDLSADEVATMLFPMIMWKASEVLHAIARMRAEAKRDTNGDKTTSSEMPSTDDFSLLFLRDKEEACHVLLCLDPEARFPPLTDWTGAITGYFLVSLIKPGACALVEEGEDFVNLNSLQDEWNAAAALSIIPLAEESAATRGQTEGGLRFAALKPGLRADGTPSASNTPDLDTPDLDKSGNWWWGTTERTLKSLSDSSDIALRFALRRMAEENRYAAMGWMGLLGWTDEWTQTFRTVKPTENPWLDDRLGDRELEQAHYTFLRQGSSKLTAHMARTWEQKFPDAGRYWIEGGADAEHITRLERLLIHASIGHGALLNALPTIMWPKIARYAEHLPSEHYTRWIWWLCRGEHTDNARWLVDEFARRGGRVDQPRRTEPNGWMTALDIALHRRASTLPFLEEGKQVTAERPCLPDLPDCEGTEIIPFHGEMPEQLIRHPDAHPHLMSARDAQNTVPVVPGDRRERVMDDTEVLVVSLLAHGANPNQLVTAEWVDVAAGYILPTDTSTTRLVRQMCGEPGGCRWSLAQMAKWIPTWVRCGWRVDVGDPDRQEGLESQQLWADMTSLMDENEELSIDWLVGPKSFGLAMEGTKEHKRSLIELLVRGRGMPWMDMVGQEKTLFTDNRLLGRYFNRLAEQDGLARKQELVMVPTDKNGKDGARLGHSSDLEYTGPMGAATAWEAMVEDWMDEQPLYRLTQDVLQAWRWRARWAAWEEEGSMLDKILREEMTPESLKILIENPDFRRICRRRLRFGLAKDHAAKDSTSWTLYKPHDFDDLVKASKQHTDHKGLKGWIATLEKRGGRDGGQRSLAKASAAGPVLSTLRRNFPHFSDLIDRIDNHLALASVGNGAFSLPPFLLAGPPGTGKTFFFSELAKAVKIPYHILNMESVSGGFAITGLDTGWGNSAAGFVFEHLVDSSVVNPIFLLDEIDKTVEGNYPVASTLLQLLEPHSAAAFQDRCVPLRMDIRPVIWVATANDLSKVSEPIKSRFEIVHVRQPDERARRGMTRAIYQSLRDNNPWGGYFEAQAPEEVVDYIARASDSARDLRKTVMTTFASAARGKRRRVSVADVPQGISGPVVDVWDEPLEDEETEKAGLQDLSPNDRQIETGMEKEAEVVS